MVSPSGRGGDGDTERARGLGPHPRCGRLRRQPGLQGVAPGGHHAAGRVHQQPAPGVPWQRHRQALSGGPGGREQQGEMKKKKNDNASRWVKGGLQF